MAKKPVVQADIPLFAVFMSYDVDQPLLEVLHSGYIGQGAKVEELEAYLAKLFGNRNILTLNSGTSALHLALRLAGVESGDEVISTAMTCTATNMPILANGGKIVWADIDPTSGLIDPLDVERKITSRTKAIMCVDWGGTPCDLDALMAIGAKYGVPVIEDAAHAMGATYKGRKIGTIADYTCFSLQAIKHITSVDGGLLLNKDTKNYRRGKLMRWYGIDRDTDRKDFRCEEDIEEWGYKFHMNDVSATIALHNFPHLQSLLDLHRASATYYNTHLPNYYQPVATKDCESAYWLYTVLLPSKTERLAFMQYMKQRGIAVSQVHSRNDTHTVFRQFQSVLPGVNTFMDRMVCIPVHWKLGVPERERIVEAATNFIEEYRRI